MFPTRPFPSVRLPLRLLGAAILAAGAAGLAPHGRTAAADGQAAEVADVNLARAAITVLDADPLLRDFNLVVSVVDRVAVVGGPVATVEMKDRAAELVRRVPGVRTVRNGCFVQTGTQPLLSPNATASRPLPVLPSVVIPLRPTTTSEATPRPTGDLVAVGPIPATGERSVVARRPATPGDNVLLPPVASPAAAAAGTPYPVVPPGVLTARPAFADAVESIRRSDPRFSGLRIEVRVDGTVVVGGTAAQPADAWDFADLVRAVPGVTRVAVAPVGR